MNGTQVLTNDGPVETDSTVELDFVQERGITRDDVPDKWEFAVFDAEDFVIYGPASVEQEDRQGQEIQMEALSGAIDRFFESREAPGIISLEHNDVPVGVPLKKWTFDDGDQVNTEIDGDTMYLVGNIANDTEKSKEARLRALAGDLDGYSVTIFSKEEGKRDGVRVTTECDLHAVTLGSDEKLVNPGAGFEVVDYKQFDNPFVPRILDRLDQKSERTYNQFIDWEDLLLQKFDSDIGQPSNVREELRDVLIELAESSAPIRDTDPGFQHAMDELERGNWREAYRVADEYVDQAPGVRLPTSFSTDMKTVQWDNPSMDEVFDDGEPNTVVGGFIHEMFNRNRRKLAKSLEVKRAYKKNQIGKQEALRGIEEIQGSDLRGDEYRKIEQWLEKPLESDTQ